MATQSKQRTKPAFKKAVSSTPSTPETLVVSDAELASANDDDMYLLNASITSAPAEEPLRKSLFQKGPAEPLVSRHVESESTDFISAHPADPTDPTDAIDSDDSGDSNYFTEAVSNGSYDSGHADNIEPVLEPEMESELEPEPQLQRAPESQEHNFTDYAEPELEHKAPTVLRGIHLDPLNSLGDLELMGSPDVTDSNDEEAARHTALTERGEHGLAETEDEDQDQENLPGYMILWNKHKTAIIAAAAFVVIGVAMLPSRTPTIPQVSTAAPVATPVPATPVATAPATGVPGAPGAPGTGMAMPTGGIEAHGISTSPDSQARLADELRNETRAILPANQVCTTTEITAFDQMRCTQVGAALFFKCAPDGRRWDVRTPGCEAG
jgi:hypothetical protein